MKLIIDIIFTVFAILMENEYLLKNMNLLKTDFRSSGFSVRCIKD